MPYSIGIHAFFYPYFKMASSLRPTMHVTDYGRQALRTVMWHCIDDAVCFLGRSRLVQVWPDHDHLRFTLGLRCRTSLFWAALVVLVVSGEARASNIDLPVATSGTDQWAGVIAKAMTFGAGDQDTAMKNFESFQSRAMSKLQTTVSRGCKGRFVSNRALRRSLKCARHVFPSHDMHTHLRCVHLLGRQGTSSILSIIVAC